MYRPTEKDRLSGLQQRRFAIRQTMTLNQTDVSFDFPTTPIDTVRVIQSMSMNLSPTAAVFVDAGGFKLFGLSAQELCFWQQTPFTRGAGVIICAICITADAHMFPGEFIRATGFFSAAGAANTINASIHGFDIPRANLF
jgi:hypothetical protein